MNSRISIEVDGGQKCKSPALAWESKPFRLVVVYTTSGSPPILTLEKLSGLDALGEECWLKVETANIPKCILEDLAKLASGDDNILKN